MPSLAELGLDVSPLKDPLSYPGRPALSDSLLLGSWLYSLTPFLEAPTDQWEITLDGGALGVDETGEGAVTLSEALDRAGAAAMDQRHPVLAIGSNASPAQLHDKFGDDAKSAAVPLTTVTVHGIDIAHSAHVSKAGYIPYAPIARPNAALRLFVTWLDDDQLSVINASERNYALVELQRDAAAATLTSGEAVQGLALYRSRWGVLRESVRARPIRAASQIRVQGILTRNGLRPNGSNLWDHAAQLDMVGDDGLSPFLA
jgi:hypothetical protein